MAAPGSDPAAQPAPGKGTAETDAESLTLPQVQLDEVRLRLSEAVAAAGPDAKARRAAVVRLLAALRKDRAEQIEARLAREPRHAAPVIAAYSALTDSIVTLVFEVTTRELHPLHLPTEGERLSVLAVGGYGRAE
ncbi:MAG: hypothetical protein RLZZ528_613, partial [Pseudomonadota bacterium]